MNARRERHRRRGRLRRDVDPGLPRRRSATAHRGVEVVHRYAHAPRARRHGALRWDWDRLVAEVERGLERRARGRARSRRSASTRGASTTACSTTAASWSSRRSRYRDAAHRRLPHPCVERDRRRAGFYELTGLQLCRSTRSSSSPRTTASSSRAPRHLVMLPELLVHHLTGVVTARAHERRAPPGCSTCTTGDWSAELADAVGVARSLLAPAATGGHAGRAAGGGSRCTSSAATTPRRRSSPAARHGRAVRRHRHLAARRSRAGPRPTRRRGMPPGSATSRARSAASACCATSPGWWLVEECRRQWGRPRPRRAPARGRGRSRPSARRRRDRPALPRARPTWPPTCAELAGLADADRAAPGPRCAVESMACVGRPGARIASRSSTAIVQLRVFGGGARSTLLLDALARRRPGDRSESARSRPPRSATRSSRRSPSGSSRRSTTHVRHSSLAHALEEEEPMNVDALERLELMRRRLDTDGRIRVAELATELDVSEMTIRRDLDLLVDEGIAARVRGGAVAVGPQEFDSALPPARARQGAHRREARSISSAPAARSASTPRRRCSGSPPASARRATSPCSPTDPTRSARCRITAA